jgi:3-ketosteroid 9alpha-monooxygenase subunit A
MGCVMAWFDPEGLAPEFDAPFLSEWNDPQWVNWNLDHLGELPIHPQEIIDNMSDLRHFGPTHGLASAFFENEVRNHFYIQRQGGPMQQYQTNLYTTTWYTGPGILISRQVYADVEIFELIANTPVDDGVVKCWHGCLYKGSAAEATEADRALQNEAQAAALEAFASDFDIWKHKRPAFKIMQLKTDGPFSTGRKWYSQFYDTPEGAVETRAKLNGKYHVQQTATPQDAGHNFDEGLPFEV